MADPIRVRFAPSPTGLLHVGGVRTALYNWLHARHERGTFVLRIEDTDETREHPDAIEQIQRSLRWCGLDWDEGPGVGGPNGPYLQSERRARHLEVAQQLLADGRVYRCWCTPDELDAERAAARVENRPFVYSRRCLRRSEAERAALVAEGRPSVLRLFTPDEGETVIVDLVRGETRFQNALLGDHVIVRSDGVPTYNFANPIDDWDMRISHVVRGEDLLPSTPRQIVLLQALGAPVPQYGHLPMILGSDRKRLSKRHGATSVEDFRERGYLPEAVVNFLALLGWRFDDSRELFTRDELVGLFTLDRVSSSSAIFDFDKLDWMNGVYMRSLPIGAFAERLVEYLQQQGSPLAEQPDTVRAAAPLVHEKLRTLSEFAGYCSFLFGRDEPDEAAWAKVAAGAGSATILATATELLSAVEPWSAGTLEGALRELCDRLELKPRAAFFPIRVALTGRTVAPGLFESAELLGRDETLARLEIAARRLAA